MENKDEQKYGERCGGAFGLVLMALSAMAFSLMSLVVHLLAVNDNFPSFELVSIRAGFGVFFCTFALRVSTEETSFIPPKSAQLTMAMRCLFGIISVSGNWFILTQLSFSDATVVVFTAPIFTAIMGHVFLGEHVKPIEAVLMSISVMGLLLVVRPQFLGFEAEPRPDYASYPRYICVVVGLFSAMCSAATNLLVRQLLGVHAMVTVFWFFLTTLVVCPLLLLAFQSPVMPTRPIAWVLCLAVGVFGFAGQAFKTIGLKHEKAGLGTMMRNLDVAFAMVYQVTLLNEPFHKLSVVGCLLILSSSLTVGYLKVQHTRRQKQLESTSLSFSNKNSVKT